MQLLERQSAADACRVEHRVLQHIKAALRVTLAWQVPSVGVDRKLASVGFTLKSFQRHLQRLMELEEDGGYLVAVAEFKPRMLEQAARLRADHDYFREALAEIVTLMDSLDTACAERMEQICQDIAALLSRVDRHDREEIGLLQEAALHDEGGEG